MVLCCHRSTQFNQIKKVKMTKMNILTTAVFCASVIGKHFVKGIK
jgi:hypothetical protein